MSHKSRRTKSPPFVMLPRYLIRSPAWADLDAVARALFVEIKDRYNGNNNGFIGLGCREAAKALHVSPDTANRAFRALEEHGFISAAQLSGFNVNGRKATEWRLTCERDDRNEHPASKEFASWGREKTNPSPTTMTLSHSYRTQTRNSATRKHLRPTTMTQTANSTDFASDVDDTSRYTTGRAVR